MSETVREGGCACGKTRYRITGEPVLVNNCHCRQCQQQTGSTSVVNAFFESERVELLDGTIREDEFEGGSGKEHVICRCTDCGCAVWSHYSGFGRLGTAVRAGTLDDPGSVTPDAVIYVVDKMPWVTLPEGIPAFDGQYNPFELLPPERQQRVASLVEKKKAGGG